MNVSIKKDFSIHTVYAILIKAFDKEEWEL